MGGQRRGWRSSREHRLRCTKLCTKPVLSISGGASSLLYMRLSRVRVPLSQETHGVGGEPWSRTHPRRSPFQCPWKQGRGISFKTWCTKSQVLFSTAFSPRMVVTWGAASARPCVHQQVVKKTEAAERDRGSNWILARFGPGLMLSFSSESHHPSSLVFSPPPAFSFGCCFTLCSSVVSPCLKRTAFSLTWGSRV